MNHNTGSVETEGNDGEKGVELANARRSLGPRPVDLCACAGKGEGQERTRLSSRRILECKQFHLWSNTVYTISDNCTHVTEYGVQAAVNNSIARI